MDRNKKQHWFLLGFSVPTPGSWQPVSLTVGLPGKVMTSVAQEAARDQNGLPPNSVLLSVSYLGQATAHQMQGTRDEDKMSSITEQFKQGMRSAALTSLGRLVVNPYTELDSPEGRFHAAEWQAGFAEAKAAATTALEHAQGFAETTA